MSSHSSGGSYSSDVGAPSEPSSHDTDMQQPLGPGDDILTSPEATPIEGVYGQGIAGIPPISGTEQQQQQFEGPAPEAEEPTIQSFFRRVTELFASLRPKLD
ncbi:hypothetical protein, conserved [Eimeria acervulina]|uniref:Uncharacterized protein n=1 Tax=Eimeria acervulina TaxID=5801 RepID=U6GGC6_EIMAC|nr:hypothetical protein, conserved [Eimeria acervulina]CDI79306.1 hypothetical protein, conserved [Eimeria acervulina]